MFSGPANLDWFKLERIPDTRAMVISMSGISSGQVESVSMGRGSSIQLVDAEYSNK